MVPRVRVVALSVGLRGGPDAHGAVVRACGEHEGVLGVVPGDAGEVAAEGLGADVMEQGSGFSVPDVDVPSYSRLLALL